MAVVSQDITAFFTGTETINGDVHAAIMGRTVTGDIVTLFKPSTDFTLPFEGIDADIIPQSVAMVGGDLYFTISIVYQPNSTRGPDIR